MNQKAYLMLESNFRSILRKSSSRIRGFYSDFMWEAINKHLDTLNLKSDIAVQELKKRYDGEIEEFCKKVDKIKYEYKWDFWNLFKSSNIEKSTRGVIDTPVIRSRIGTSYLRKVSFEVNRDHNYV